MVTLAAGPGFDENELPADLRSTYSYADLNDLEWSWALDFVTRAADGLMRTAEQLEAQASRAA